MSKLVKEQLEYYKNTYDRFDGISSDIFENICDELIAYKKLEEELGVNDLITFLKWCITFRKNYTNHTFDDLVSFYKKAIKVCNISECDTLREYINTNSKGSYHHFIFNIENKEIDITSVCDFEHFYNSNFLDDYVVIADDKTSNNGDCTSYVCEHRLSIKKIRDK